MENINWTSDKRRSRETRTALKMQYICPEPDIREYILLRDYYGNGSPSLRVDVVAQTCC